MNKQANTIDINLAHVDEKQNILVVLELALNGCFEPVEAVRLINDVHFDENGSTGNYSLLSPDACDLNAAFVHSVDEKSKDKIKSLYNYSVNKGDEITTVKILLVVEEYSTIEEEMNALALEFDEFVQSKSCIEWKQLPMPGSLATVPA